MMQPTRESKNDLEKMSRKERERVRRTGKKRKGYLVALHNLIDTFLGAISHAHNAFSCYAPSCTAKIIIIK
jgi:hypothetical protein